MEFKDILKDFLIEKGISQQAFAKSIGTTQGTVSKWLSGIQEPRFSQIKNICKIYNVDANFLLGITEF